MPDRTVLDDIVILGRAVPEAISGNRVTVCLGGFSLERGEFIRLYPTKARYKDDDKKLRRWDVIRAEVERNPNDNRKESWKIVGSGDDWEHLEHHIERLRHISNPDLRRKIVEENLSPCVQAINKARRSLGLIRPAAIIERGFRANEQFERPVQRYLFSEIDETRWVRTKRSFDRVPYVKYRCSDCQTKQGYHQQQVLEWGFFEWIRKHPDNMAQVWKNARFDDPNYDIYFFVGNQAHRRASFLIISVLRIQKGGQALLF